MLRDSDKGNFNMFKIIRKADCILFAVLILIAVFISVFFFINGQNAENAAVYIGDSLYGSWPLNEDRTITVEHDGHTNIVEIGSGKVWMNYSDCSNQNCVDQGKISSTGQVIVCLPNEIIVRIEGSSSSELDAVSK